MADDFRKGCAAKTKKWWNKDKGNDLILRITKSKILYSSKNDIGNFMKIKDKRRKIKVKNEEWIAENEEWIVKNEKWKVEG